MSPDHNPKPTRIRQLPFLLLGASLLGILVAVAILAVIAVRQVDRMASTYADNSQYSLAQLDVDAYRLQASIERARLSGTSDLSKLRRDFDLLYSRVLILQRRAINGSDLLSPGLNAELKQTGEELDALVQLIDRPDEELRESLGELSDRIMSISLRSRSLTSRGAQDLSAISDARRGDLRQLLMQMAATVLALIAAVSVLAVVLMRLWQLSRARATAVSRAERYVRTVVDTSLDAIFVCDGDGVIRDLNSTATRLFAPTDDSLIGQSLSDVLRASPGDALSFLRSPDLSGPAKQPVTLEALDAKGDTMPVELSADRITGEKGALTVIYLRDISDRLRAEAQLVEARDRAMAGERAKADFLAVMSHEMRTPLNGLLGTLELLAATSLEPRQAGLVSNMRGAGRHLLELVNDILLSAEVDAGMVQLEYGEIDVPATINAVVANMRGLAEARGNTLAWSFDGIPVTRMRGDPRRVRQVLLNLVGNAIKFTENGRIDIDIARRGTEHPEIEISVRDTGVGIPESCVDTIFDDFSRSDSSYARRTGGTGLGLGIARRLARLMGGDVGVEAREPEGSTFWLRLPITAPDTNDAVAKIPVSMPPSDQLLHLLVVEDNRVNAMILRAFFEADGHVVDTAESGSAALEHAGAKRYDAILMDISMPGMDGIETIRAIRARGGPSAATPAIAVTAHALPSELRDFREAGMVTHISKPVNRDSIRSGLARALAATENAAILPIVDPGRLVSLNALAEPEQLSALHAQLLAETDPAIERLASDDVPAEEIRETAHRIGSSVAAMGLSRLSSRLFEIETAAERGKTDTTGLTDLWHLSRAALDEALPRRID